MTKEERKVYMKQYRQEHKEANNKAQKRWKKLNPDKVKEWQRKYFKTPMGRAIRLLNGYKQKDELYNRGECTLTAQWIVENIFTKPCAHCGKTGWEIIGCNRINNSLPHTPENVEPCCFECNRKFSAGRPKKLTNIK